MGNNHIRIVGCPGAGKSTLASRLAERHDLDHVELDALFHMPGWTPKPIDEFRAEVQARLADSSERGWVVDGNYGSKLGTLVDDAADTIVWLDLPRRLIMRRLVGRSLTRALTGEELWNGNRERLRNLFRWDPEENLLRWAWVRHPVYRRRYAEATTHVWAGKSVHRLTSPEEVEAFVSTFAGRLRVAEG